MGIFFLVWFAIGAVGALFWPLYYVKNMSRKDWIKVVTWFPIHTVFGPLAFLTSYPM